jgi:DNA polymerase-3 subunit delta'
MSLELEGAIPPAENTKLFGHKENENFLAAAFKSGRIHHAILLEGEQGIGKATFAFRLANHILNNPDTDQAPDQISDPDPENPIFRQVAGEASHNLMHIKCEVDAKTGKTKSSISVDDIRRTGKFFAQTSGSNNWRIAIIDTADDLNRSAANAILKILEEPPKRALFLVLSNSPGRLLSTIRSRCLSLHIKSLNDQDMVSALNHLDVVNGLDNASIRQLLKLSEGSVSRALTILNYGGAELIGHFNDIIDQDSQADRKTLHKLAESLAKKDQETSYHFLVDHMITHTMEQAKTAANAGQISKAAELAELSEKLNNHKTESDIYNLDRKQTILTLFSMMGI